MKIKKAIITAAGFGSRFLPITKTLPKELLPIIDKPILHYLVQECADAGIEEIFIVVSPSEVSIFEDYFFGKATAIKTLMHRQSKLDRWNKVEKVFELPLVTIVPQDDSIAYGNGRPILSAKEFVRDEEAFAVLFGDDIVLAEESSVKQLVEYFYENPCDGLLGVQEVYGADTEKYGMLKLKDNSENEVEKVIEKPKKGESPSNLASYGRFILTSKIFEYLTSDSTGKDGEVWLQDANDKLATNGKVLFKKLNGEWMTTGDPLNYLKAHIKFALKDESLKHDLKEFIDSL